MAKKAQADDDDDDYYSNEDPHDLDSTLIECHELYRMGMYDDAVHCYETESEIWTDDHVIRRNYRDWCDALIRLERFDEDTVEVCDMAEIYVPDNSTEYYMILISKGKALCGMGMHKQGIECYDRVIKTIPDNLAVHHLALLAKGVTLRRLGRTDDALLLFQNVIETALKGSAEYGQAAALLSEMQDRRGSPGGKRPAGGTARPRVRRKRAAG